jgi:hypothetical protein
LHPAIRESHDGADGLEDALVSPPTVPCVKLSRHARNRGRRIRRAHEHVSERGLKEALFAGHTLGYDGRGHRRVLVGLGSTEIVLVIDEEAKLIITMWVR